MPIKVLLIMPEKGEGAEIMAVTERLLAKYSDQFMVERLSENNIAALGKSACLPCENFCVSTNFDEISSSTYEQLISRGYRIYGPGVIFDYLNHGRYLGKPLPRRQQALYAQVLNGTIVSASGINREEKDRICKLVRLLGGDYSGDLTSSVTHLLANRVTTSKCSYFRCLGKPIFTPNLIDKIWQLTTKGLQLNPSIFAKFQLPPFAGLEICASGFCEQDVQCLKRLTEKNGGTFSEEMKQDTTTHLVLASREGCSSQMYAMASEWGTVNLVSHAWFTESVKTKYCLPEDNFKL